MSPSHSPSGFPSSTATARVIDGLALYGHTPHVDEPEWRPVPDPEALRDIVGGVFGALSAPLADTALAVDVQDLLWSVTDLFHRKSDRIQRMLDDNEMRQKASQDEQDGSEIRSVELERLIEKGRALLDRRNAYETMRDAAADQYAEATGSVWRPRSGSMVNHKTMTASLIESRDMVSAKRRAETEVMLPAGPKIAFAGGKDCNDHDRIWAVLDKVHAKHPDMVLLHGGSDRGAERIAQCWANTRKVTEVAFRPNWKADGDRAAPFKRNDRLIDIMPIGLVVFPGNGITDNLADKARLKGIPLIDERKPKA